VKLSTPASYPIGSAEARCHEGAFILSCPTVRVSPPDAIQWNGTRPRANRGRAEEGV